MYIKLNSNR